MATYAYVQRNGPRRKQGEYFILACRVYRHFDIGRMMVFFEPLKH